jgi:DNA-binding transcriptional regulator YdaS (Cro superfamily)
MKSPYTIPKGIFYAFGVDLIFFWEYLENMTTNLNRFEALKLAVLRAGSQESFADAMGVAQGTVSKWLRLSKQLPAENVLTAERLYGVSRHDLRPDIYPRPIMVDQGSADRFYGVDHLAKRVA